MELTVYIPDDIAARLETGADDLPRRAPEAFAEEYRAGRVHKPDLRRLLGFETSDQIDTYLKAHGVLEEYTAEELERDLLSTERFRS